MNRLKLKMVRLPALCALCAPCACLCSIILISLLSGCVSSNPGPQVRKFADAVALTTTNAAEVFAEVQAGYVAEEISATALLTNVTEVANVDLRSVKPFISPETIQARLVLLGGLQLYAAKLSLLLDNPAAAALDRQTTDFANELNEMDTNLVTSALLSSEPFTARDIDIFAAAWNAVAHWILTYEEDKQARLEIGRMKGPVDQMCGLLAKDLLRLHGQFTAEYKQTRQNDSQAMLQSWPNLGPMERREELANLRQLTISIEKADATVAALQSAITNLAASHAMLDQLFTTNRISAIARIDAFSADAKRISSYYQSLPTTQ
jgi:hypothetical protein